MRITKEDNGCVLVVNGRRFGFGGNADAIAAEVAVAALKHALVSDMELIQKLERIECSVVQAENALLEPGVQCKEIANDLALARQVLLTPLLRKLLKKGGSDAI